MAIVVNILFWLHFIGLAIGHCLGVRGVRGPEETLAAVLSTFCSMKSVLP
jgi:hypothetical protein